MNARSETPAVPFRRLIIALELFAAVTALAGGLALLLWPHGNVVVPLWLLDTSPFKTFIVPGALLAVVVGGSNLASGVLVWRRSRAAIDAMLLAGGAMTVWIVAESAILREFSWLHLVYGLIGLTVLGVGISAALRSGVARHRWLVIVTACEAVGFLAPSIAGTLSTSAGFSAWPQAALLVAAGSFEGLLLGTGQALAFPFAVRKVRYVALTSLAAAFVWACVMGAMLLGASDAPVAMVVITAAIAGPVGLVSIGFAQWLALREAPRRSTVWIGWTTLAWAVALPLSFTPGPFVDASTPLAVHLILWSASGLVMAWVMALITWQGVLHVSGATTLRARFFDDLARAALPEPGDAPLPPVTEADLAALPEPTRRYFRFMGVLGRPRDRTFRLGFVGRFKSSPAAPWRRCEAWQYNTSAEVTRTFSMRLRLAGLPVIGRDTYRAGHGRMLVRLLDRVTVADGRGAEFDVGELTTYLNDLVLLAPSMLLTPAVRFTEVDAHCFEVSLDDHGLEVTARVFVDDRGAPVNFVSTDRFLENPAKKGEMLRARWSTPIAGFQELDGRRLPTRATAIWHLPSGELPYADFALVPESVSFNVGCADEPDTRATATTSRAAALVAVLVACSAVSAFAQSSIFPSESTRKAARQFEAQTVLEESRAFLKTKMKNHGAELRDLALAVATLRFSEAQRLAQELANQPRLDPTSGPAMKLPTRFFELQDELKKNAQAVADAAKASSVNDTHAAFSRVVDTCMSCHVAFRK